MRHPSPVLSKCLTRWSICCHDGTILALLFNTAMFRVMVAIPLSVRSGERLEKVALVSLNGDSLSIFPLCSYNVNT